MNIIRVAAASRSTAVAGAIAKTIREGEDCVIQVVGCAALNQAIKAVAIARSFLVENGVDLAVVPAFVGVPIEGEERTAIRLYVESRRKDEAPDVPIRDGRTLQAT